MLTTINDTPVFVCPAEGNKLANEADALELIGETFGAGATLVVIPVERLPDSFFELKSGVAGQILQKFINYQRRLAIVGDVSSSINGSRAFKDFVYEANQGRQIWFVQDIAELTERLATAQ